MARKIARLVVALFGAAVGVAVGIGLLMAVDSVRVSMEYISLYERMYSWGIALIYAASGLVMAIIFYFISPWLIDGFLAAIGAIEAYLSRMETADVFYCSAGLIVGLLIAFLLSTLTAGIQMGLVRFMAEALLYVTIGYLGWSVMYRRRGELPAPGWMARKGGRPEARTARPKLLDTSVIIDGRIADICATGIIEGTLVVPRFVLSELQHIADSADSLKRNRGRRGLDIIKMLQEGNVPVTIASQDYDDISEVDAKLIRLTHEMGGVVVTNDYNLNKVAGVQDVPVLNINELANAIKPLALPGEEMLAGIVKEGKENGQGVAYLDDGTMIVVEGGRRCMGETVAVIVTSVLQTAAGRMIFAKLK
ncbi:MAG: TRAM domain-containing protein [Candidatus Pelethousia sp.]|nr:TRAM domain-containing protein [Candidatus Pelethousia sp.]